MKKYIEQQVSNGWDYSRFEDVESWYCIGQYQDRTYQLCRLIRDSSGEEELIPVEDEPVFKDWDEVCYVYGLNE